MEWETELKHYLFTIPEIEVNMENCQELATNIAMAVFGTLPGNTVYQDTDHSYICGIQFNCYSISVEGNSFLFSARYQIPAWLPEWLTYRFKAKGISPVADVQFGGMYVLPQTDLNSN